MRRIWLLSCLLLTVLPSWAAKRLSVAQLEHLLSQDVAAHKQDSEIARQIASVSLAERISTQTLSRLNAQFPASPLTSAALRLLADQSQFLELPANESVSSPAPDAAAGARMLQAAQGYVSQTLRGLPNFLSTRTITLYDDTPEALKQGEWAMRSGLHLVGTSSAEISVSREREDEPPAQGSAVWQSKIGLLSGGEFGTTLGMILADTAKGEISWNHWEGTPSQLIAVFRYSVPASASHFELIGTFQREASVEGVRGPANDRGIAGIGVRPNVSSSNIEAVRTHPGYHGFIWLNPTDGTIDRITLEADISKGLPFRRAAMLVEYGPIEIAGERFICPVRSLALSEMLATAESFTGDTATAWLNETVFSNYHRFASSSRILDEAANTAGSAPVAQEQAAANPPQATSPKADSIPPPQPEEDSAPASGRPQPAGPSPLSVEPAATEAAPAKNARASETPAAAELSANGSPPPESITSNLPQPLAGTPDENKFHLSLHVNSLLVPVVVLDKRGQSLAGLSKDDFTVEDNGRKRKVIGFTVVKGAPHDGKRSLDSETGVHAGAGAPDSGTQNAQPPAPRSRHIVFLFDDRHLTTADLAIVQKAATHLFDAPLPTSDDAAVLSFFGVNSGLTRDRSALQSAIMHLAVHPAVHHEKENCPDVDYYSADQIINKHNPMEFQIAVQKARQCSFSQDMVKPSSNLYDGMNNASNPFQSAAMAAAANALAEGEEDARVSLVTIGNVVRGLSKLPGRSTLILVSPGFLTLAPEAMAMKSEVMDIAAASDVIVNALDARGLYVGNLDASEGGSTSMLGLASGTTLQDHLASMQANENVMSELAAGTGGRYFHNNNDLQGGMESLAAAPQNLYLLEISLNDVKANGAYHRLQVQIDHPGVEVMARKGYFSPKAPAGKN